MSQRKPSLRKPSLRKLLLCAPAALLAGCPEPLAGSARSEPSFAVAAERAPSEGPVLATIGASTLTVQDLELRLNAQSPFVRARYTTDERKKEFVDNQVRFEVLAQEAFRRGMHQEPDVQESLKKILVQKLTRQEFDGRVSLDDITEQEMRAYFDAHLADYNKPEMMRASLILIPFGDDKQRSKAAAERVQKLAADPKKLEDRGAFKALVAEHSKDEASLRTGGDLRYVSATEVEERYGAAAKEALFAAQTLNEVTPAVEGKGGWLIFKRTGRRKPIVREFDQVKNQIRNVLYREKRTQAFDAYVEGLKQELGVTIRDELIPQIQVAPGGGGELMAPGHGHDHGSGDEHEGEPR